MGLKRTILDAAHRSGGLRGTGAAFGPRALRVLAYHRVTDVGPDFDTFRGNVSASPEEFAAQMDEVAERYHPVGLDRVLAAIEGGPELPRRAVLVTFDDGYRDNLTVALPVLAERGIPAVLFAATDAIDTNHGFWWDRVAWCFAHAARDAADLPEAGRRSWSDLPAREVVTRGYIEFLKTLPEPRKADAVAALPEALGVTIPDDAFAGLALEWDEVRAMADTGVVIDAHTCSHPVLSRVDLDRARDEIRGSRDRIAAETGRVPVTFAYPNGHPADYTDAVVDTVADAGFRAAFTLVPGPARRRELIGDPLRIRRIYVHHGDDRARFAAKLAGVPRLVGALR